MAYAPAPIMKPHFESIDAPPSSSWRRVSAHIARGWALLQVGALLLSALLSGMMQARTFSMELLISMILFLFIGISLRLPASLLLKKQRPATSSYLLAALLPALCVPLDLLLLSVGIKGDRGLWPFFLMDASVRIALVAALRSAAYAPPAPLAPPP